MITKSNRLNLSNNESIGEVSVDSNCDRVAPEATSSEPSNEEAPVNYIENKIISLLNQADDKASVPSSSKEQEVDRPVEAVEKSPEKTERISGMLAAEDSCNAVDNKISSCDDETSHNEVPPGELSFNGKIKSLNAPCEGSQCELASAKKGLERTNTNEKVRKDKLNESFEILTKENSSLMHYNNEKSPDLFADDDNDDSCMDDSKSDSDEVGDEDNVTSTSAVCVDPIAQIEKTLLKKLQSSLSGVLPPPSVTYPCIDASRMLTLFKQNEDRLFYRNEVVEPFKSVCLSKPTHSPEELRKLEWPELMKARAHGLYYNHSIISEKIDMLGLKYIDRYIGSETSSTLNETRAPCSTRKRNLPLKMLNQSPGSRLSHLARRRAVFSSANLLNSSVGSCVAGTSSSSRRSCNRQILLDPKKSDNRRKHKGRTPKRRTPGRRKTPRRKTPGSSVKKRMLSLPVAKATQPHTREGSKRALFQSPSDDPVPKASSTSTCVISRAVASKVQKSKRALFSPAKPCNFPQSSACDSRSDIGTTQRYESSTNNVTILKESSGIRNMSTGETVDLVGPNGKRKRPVDDEDDEKAIRCKLPRMDSIKEEDLTPRSLRLARSQSFCVGSQTLNSTGTSESSLCGKYLYRANSEVVFPHSGSRPVTTLTENHKKKLLWAVSQALQSKQISVKHENFKHVASNLARVVKRLFLEFNDHSVSSTSEKLLRLAHKHVFEVIQGQNVDDIYLKEKTRIMNMRNILKPNGYISPKEYEQRKQMMRRASSASVLILGGSIDASQVASSSQPLPLSQGSIFSQSSEFLNQLSQLSSVRTYSQSSAFVESTSKNTILRENIDSEQRQKSAQKQMSFSGKDQKNVSPYADSKSGSQAKAKLLVGGVVLPSSILKAKRQISFE
ncbi:uncharacterized protein mi isoform X2 [Ochlerotatus camptorhynchus]